MKKLCNIGYSLRDVAIVQAPIANTLRRGDVDPFIEICNRKSLPIFVAPMASVTDEKNYKIWIDNVVTPVVPRSIMYNCTFNDRLKIAHETFVSFSLNEAVQLYNMDNVNCSINNPIYICIDIAHGTLSSLLDICENIKKKYGDAIIIMTGNIANAEAYREYCMRGIDYVRCGIGGGSRCTSSANVGVHTPMATLLDDIQSVKDSIITYNKLAEKNNEAQIKLTKVIADGGIGWFDDINKALAMGADAVMIGKLFAECTEACGEIKWSYSEEDCKNDNWLTTAERDRWIESLEDGTVYMESDELSPYKMKPFRDYYGMSTKRAQLETKSNGIRTSEGIDRPVEVKYSVKKWLDNVESYLRSAMTYTNSKNISEFNDAKCIILGGNSYGSFMK